MWQVAGGASARFCACARPAQVRAEPSTANARATAGRPVLHFLSSGRSCIPDAIVGFMVSPLVTPWPLAFACSSVETVSRKSVQCQPQRGGDMFVGKLALARAASGLSFESRRSSCGPLDISSPPAKRAVERNDLPSSSQTRHLVCGSLKTIKSSRCVRSDQTSVVTRNSCMINVQLAMFDQFGPACIAELASSALSTAACLALNRGVARQRLRREPFGNHCTADSLQLLRLDQRLVCTVKVKLERAA